MIYRNHKKNVGETSCDKLYAHLKRNYQCATYCNHASKDYFLVCWLQRTFVNRTMVAAPSCVYLQRYHITVTVIQATSLPKIIFHVKVFYSNKISLFGLVLS